MASGSRKLRLRHSRFGAGNAPVSLAIDQGFFERKDIDVDRMEVGRTSDAVKSAVAREADLVVCGGVPIVRAAMEGGDPLIVMSLEDENVVAIMGNRDIKVPEDLRGKVIGVVGFGDQDFVLLRRQMKNWGFDPDEDVTFEELGHRGALWEALLAGEIAAMSATIPQPLLAEKIGIPVLHDFRDEHEPWQVGTFVTTRRFADENPELLRDFLAGLREGIELFASDFEISLPHLKARSKLDDEDVLRETHRLFGTAMQNYVPREAPIRAVARDLEAATGEKVDVNFAAIVDDSYVPKPG